MQKKHPDVMKSNKLFCCQTVHNVVHVLYEEDVKHREDYNGENVRLKCGLQEQFTLISSFV